VEAEINMLVGRGRPAESKEASAEYGKKSFHALELTLMCQGSKRTPSILSST
jgi:hypothetical protein